MTLETKKVRKVEGTDAWETALARRLADDLDAFLATASDETFLFAEETSVPRRLKRRVNRRSFKRLATVAAAVSVLAVVATAASVYNASLRKNETVESSHKNDETSLLAWSVENWGEAELSRHVETHWTKVDFFGLRVSLPEEGGAPRNASPEPLGVVDENVLVEEDKTEKTEAFQLLGVKKLEDVAALEPLKYEPFLQVVVASLQ